MLRRWRCCQAEALAWAQYNMPASPGSPLVERDTGTDMAAGVFSNDMSLTDHSGAARPAPAEAMSTPAKAQGNAPPPLLESLISPLGMEGHGDVNGAHPTHDAPPCPRHPAMHSQRSARAARAIEAAHGCPVRNPRSFTNLPCLRLCALDSVCAADESGVPGSGEQGLTSQEWVVLDLDNSYGDIGKGWDLINDSCRSLPPLLPCF